MHACTYRYIYSVIHTYTHIYIHSHTQFFLSLLHSHVHTYTHKHILMYIQSAVLMEAQVCLPWPAHFWGIGRLEAVSLRMTLLWQS